MKLVIPALIVTSTLILFFKSGFAQDAPPVPAEMKLIEDRIGVWDSEIVTRPCVLVPHGDKLKGVETNERILGGRYHQTKNANRPGSPDNTLIVTYDQNSNVFRHWYFDDAGNTAVAAGTWDAAKRTLTWSQMTVKGTTTNGTWQFIDKDNYEWRSVTRDRDGKVLIDVTAKLKRRK